MPDPGDRMAARYRELARDEPPAAVDAAILAAGRRAVGSRPGGTARWAGPVSIAAVLVLGLTVSLRMQVEQPGIETSSARMEPEVREQPAAATAPPVEPPRSELANAETPAAPSAEPAMRREREREKTSLRKEFTPSPPRDTAARPGQANESAQSPAPTADAARAPSRPAPAGNMIAAAPAPAQITTPATAAAPPPPPSVPAPRSFAPEPGASRQTAPSPQSGTPLQADSSAASGASAQAAPRPATPAAMRAAPAERRESPSQGAARSDAPILEAEAARNASPESQLERIAKLREANRDEEADRALEEFRRHHPDYRIPAPMWERVRGR